MSKNSLAVIVRFAVASVLLGSSGIARANLVSNGGFEMTTNGPGQLVSPPLNPAGSTQAPGWTSPDYNFDPAHGFNMIVDPAMADIFTPTVYGGMALWGPNSTPPSMNGLSASPDGGYFLAADGDSVSGYNGRVEQTLTGLTPGQLYEVGFYWAGAQQYYLTGANTEYWQVSFGSQTQTTPVVNNASTGFTGWMYQTMYFTATSTSEVLSFLAFGTPAGGPPFVLLDGVSVNAVPEPSTLLTCGGALVLVGIGTVRRLRRGTRSEAV